MLLIALGFGLIVVVYFVIRNFGSGAGHGSGVTPGHMPVQFDSTYNSESSHSHGHGGGGHDCGHGCGCGGDGGCDSGGSGGDCGCDGGGGGGSSD